ncbi:MAG: PH domain-containing protein [Bacilli bacterium]|nr:PH domain-containing protein [Bacilli bacterium]
MEKRRNTMVEKNHFEINENIKQNEIEDILGEDEEELLTLKPDRKDYILESVFKGLPVILLWVAFDTFFIVMMIINNVFKENPWILIPVIAFFALHLLPLWLYIANIVKRVIGYKNISYVFTDKRIIIRSGIIGIDFKYLYYADISSVEVKVSILDRIFKVGDLHIKSATQTAVLDDIKSPYIYANKIMEITRDLKADLNYPNDLRPKENHGYNTKYKKDIEK